MPHCIRRENKRDEEKVPELLMVFQLDPAKGEVEQFVKAFPFFEIKPSMIHRYVGPGEDDFVEVSLDAPKMKVTVELSYFKTK
jgi:hypothetical protein